MNKLKNILKSIRIDINNLDDLSKSSQQYTEIYYQLEELQSKLNHEIFLVKEKYTSKIESLSEILKKIETSIFEYIKINKESIFKDSKSINLPYAKIGIRKSSQIHLPEDHQELITKLKALGKNYLISYSETLKKSSFASFSDLELELLNISRTYSETPFIIPSISLK